jgi:hypothetical protein
VGGMAALLLACTAWLAGYRVSIEPWGMRVGTLWGTRQWPFLRMAAMELRARSGTVLWFEIEVRQIVSRVVVHR